MSVILAIEPDAAQADALREALEERFGAKLLVVESREQAVVAVDREMPDLVLVSALLSPRDEDELLAHLRANDQAAHLQPLTIPQLRVAPARGRSSLFGLGRKKKASPASAGCDPSMFADEIATYLTRAREIRKKPRAARPAVRPALAAAPPVASAVNAWPKAPAGPRADNVPAHSPAAESNAWLPTPSAMPQSDQWEPAASSPPDVEEWPPAAPEWPPPDSEAVAPILQELQTADPSPIDHLSMLDQRVDDDAIVDAIDRVVDRLNVQSAAADPDPPIDLLVETGIVDREAADAQDEAEARTRADAEVRERAEIEARLRAGAAAEERAAADRLRAEAAAEERAAAERLRAEVEAEERAAAEARRREEAEAQLRAEAEARLAAELERVQTEAAQRREAELAQWQAEAESLREATVRRAREAVEAEAREALAAELAQVRAEAEELREAELTRLHDEAEQRADAAARQAREVAEVEGARALAEELGRVRAEAEAAAARALEEELARVRGDAEAAAARALEEEAARVRAEAQAHLEAELGRVRRDADRARAEAQARLDAELERVRQESEHARRIGQSEAQAEAEKIRAAAAHEARAAAEAAATRTLQVEIERVRAEVADARRAQTAAQVEAEKLREAAAREAREVAEAAAGRALQAEIERVRADADERLAAELAQLRADAERRRALELEEMQRQVAEMREAAAQQARSAAAEAIAAEVARVSPSSYGSRPPTIVRAPMRSPAPVSARPAPEPLEPADPVPAPASSSYYDLWRSEDAASAEPAGIAYPAGLPSRFRDSRWTLPIAASLLLIVCGAISVDGRGWLETAEKALSVIPSKSASDAAPAAATTTGQLMVETTPPGARVSLDGTFRGVTPLTLDAVAPGTHRVVLESSAGVVRRDVVVRAGERAIASEAIMAGWVSVFSRIPLDVIVNGRRIGSSEDSQVMLPPGRHRVTLRNQRFNYRETVTLDVQPGKGLTHNVTLPTGRISVAEPAGAEVWIEGERAGEAPLRDVAVAIGTREVVIRHPESGEQRQMVEVRAGATTEVRPLIPGPSQPGAPPQLLPLSRKPSGN